MFDKLNKMEDLNSRYKDQYKKFDELIKSNDYISNQFNTANGKIAELTENTSKLDHEMTELRYKYQLLHKTNDNLLDRVLKLETSERKLNLVVDGIQEQCNESEAVISGIGSSLQ